MTYFITDALIPSPHQGTLIVYTPPLDAAYFCATQRITSVVQRELIAAVGSPHTTDADTLDAEGNGHGKYTTSDGTSYEGGLLKWQPHGWGKYVWPDRVSFEGSFVEGLKQGPGKHTCSNGDIFKGIYVGGLKQGPGKHTWSNGDIFEGIYVGGLKQGPGKHTCSNGDIFEGIYVGGLKQGPGKHAFSNGDIFEGEYVEDLKHGPGKHAFSNGDIFEGYYVNNKKHGHGKYTEPNGFCFEGDYVENLKHGPGKVTLPSGVFYNALFVKNILRTNASNLTNLAFIQLLLGTLDGGEEPTYAAGIISDFLKIGHAEYAFQIDRAMQFMISPIHESEMLYQTLNDGQTPKEGRSFLLCSGYVEHAIGLNIIQESHSPNLVYLEIFNSGEGLDRYHIRRGEKFQTRLQARALLENITPEIIKKWMDNKCHDTIHDVYEAILDLPKSQVFDPDEETAVYQTPQKGDNCSFEWMAAYLRHALGELGYNQMRLQLFKSCMPGPQKQILGWPVRLSEKTRNHHLQLIQKEFQRKIEKREERIERLLNAMDRAEAEDRSDDSDDESIPQIVPVNTQTQSQNQ